jgi:anti-sigma factor RsiW
MEIAEVFRIQMNDRYCDHPNEEALERFLLQQCSEEELEVVETHVLACESCVAQLEALELDIAATKMALENLEAKPQRKHMAKAAGAWKSWFTIPRLSLAGGAAVLACGAILLSVPHDVALTAYRGTETAIVSEWRPLQMHLNAADLNEGPVQVEVVDRLGSPVWKGASTVRNDSVDVHLPRIKQSGTHFLRLYNPQGDLLREYAFQVKWKF